MKKCRKMYTLLAGILILTSMSSFACSGPSSSESGSESKSSSFESEWSTGSSSPEDDSSEETSSPEDDSSEETSSPEDSSSDNTPGYDPIDPQKTYLFVGNYNGALGSAWLEEVAKRYEALHPDVKIRIENDKDRYEDGCLADRIGSYGYDMYFVNGITYSNYVSKGLVADITDVVTEGGANSIANRMNPTLRDYYDVDKTAAGEQYYAVPFHDSLFGTVYDVDLFEGRDIDGELTGDILYFRDITSNTFTTDLSQKSVGPNGIAGDYDDGLPATFEQWKALMTKMKNIDITPYTWTSEYYLYRYRWLTSIWADYEGKENFDLNMSFNGTYNGTPISVHNAYELQGQPGKKYALDYAEYIIRNNLYTNESFDTTYCHTAAQEAYLRSIYDSKYGYRSRIAMIMEGVWWENECSYFFDELATHYDDENLEYGTRKFGFMPVPKADVSKVGTGTTLISSTANSAAFIYKNTPKMELAKDFFKFAHSEESMRTFTRMTGGIRPFDYELEASDRAEMTYFQNQVWDIYHDTKTDISYVSLYSHDAFIENSSYLGWDWWWRTRVGSITGNDVFWLFKDNSSLTAADYFAGQKAYYQETWAYEMKDYLN